MADIAWQTIQDSDWPNVVYLAETLTSTNLGSDRLRLPGNMSDLIVQVVGTFDSASVTVRGSLLSDPDTGTAADWFTLNDANGDAATLSAAGAVSLASKPKWLSILTASGTGSQDLDVYLQTTRVFA